MSKLDNKLEWLSKPLLRVQKIFEDCQISGDDWRDVIPKSFLDDIDQLEIYSQIPWLNETPLHKLASNQIVRFRGMIQDMLEQEFFMDTFEVQRADGTKILKPGRYLDVASCAPNEAILHSSNCETGDRTSYYCISIPGENEWVKENYEKQNPKLNGQIIDLVSHAKRPIDDEEKILDPPLFRFNEEDKCSTDQPSFEAKRLREEKLEEVKDISSKSKNNFHELNFPFTDMKGMACLVKIYEESDFKLNDMVEIIGILSIDPSIGSVSNVHENCEEEFISKNECEPQNLPSSLVPRLHVLKIVKKDHNNPLLPLKLSEGDFPNQPHPSNMRELLGSILDVALLGDGLASEYLLCHLVSSVYLRQNVMALGKFSLNLFGITQELLDQDYPKHLFNLLQSLTTHCHFLPISLENMNKLNFIPKKDYDSNRLRSGILQLPPHLHLVLDETSLTPGQLDSNGIQNLTALGNLVNWQKVDYDFQFHSLEQHSNVPVLVLSEGKSIISSDSHVRLDPKHTNVALAFSKVSTMLNDHQVLDQLRSHLTFSKLAPYNLPENMQTKVQEDFVDSRQHENGMSADDLHSLLTVAKLLAQGCGQTELTNEIWRSAKMLEAERKCRLKS